MIKHQYHLTASKEGFCHTHCVTLEQIKDFKGDEYKAYVYSDRSVYFDHAPSELDIKGVFITHVLEAYRQSFLPEEVTFVSPVKKEEKMLFKTNENEQMARALIHVLDLSNRTNLLCGHGHDQVYGPAYDALKNLMNHLFGEDVTVKAMNSNTWGPHDFDGQIVPAIEWAIEEVAQEKKKKRAEKMVATIQEHYHTAYYDDGIGCIKAVSGNVWREEEVTEIPLSWDEVYKWLGY